MICASPNAQICRLRVMAMAHVAYPPTDIADRFAAAPMLAVCGWAIGIVSGETVCVELGLSRSGWADGGLLALVRARIQLVLTLITGEASCLVLGCQHRVHKRALDTLGDTYIA